MRPERHHSNQGLYATRSSTPAPGSPSTHLTDAATARGSMPPVSALQPSFRPVLQPKHPRPVSRDPGNSAWPAPQHADPGQNLLHGTRQLSANRPSSNAASRALTSTQHALRRNTASQAVHIQQPASSQRQHSARPASSHRLNSANRHTTSNVEHGGASRAMGMTLSQYMSQMPSRTAAAGESWARPVSASLTAEDCEPPGQLPGVEHYSDIEDDDSPGWRDEDWDTSPGPPTSSFAGQQQRGGGSFAGNPHLMLSARGNGLDLRPATASGLLHSEPSSVSCPHDATATRETDLGSLSAQLFAPRPQSQGGFRPPSRRLSRPSSAHKAASNSLHPHAASQGSAADLSVDAAGSQSGSLLIKGGRKIQSARPADRGQRPPSRQKPPPEALHLFQPIHGPHTGGFAPSPVLRTAASLARPSTSASIMQQAGTATRSRPAPTLHSGRMTLADVQLLSNAAASTSQAIAAAGPVVDGRNSSARLPSARPVSARRL